MYRSTIEGRFLKIDTFAANLLGYESSEEFLTNIRDIDSQFYVDSRVRQKILARIKEGALKSGNIVTIATHVYNKSRKPVFVAESFRLVKDDSGRPCIFEGVFADLSHLDSTEISHNGLASVISQIALNYTNDAICIMAADKVIFANSMFASLCSSTTETLNNTAIENVFSQSFIANHLSHEITGPSSGMRINAEEMFCPERPGVTARLALQIINPTDNQAIHVIVAQLEHQAPVADRGNQRLLTADSAYDSFFHDAVIGMYRSTISGKYICVNETLAKMFGYESAADLCLNVANISDLYVNRTARDETLRALEETGFIRSCELQLRRKDGSTFYASCNARLVRDQEGRVTYLEGMIQDITDLKTAISERASSEERYRALVDNCHVGIFTAQAGEFRFVNTALSDMLGYGGNELVGRRYQEVLAPEDQDAAAQIESHSDSRTSAPFSAEVRLLHKDGRTRVIAALSVTCARVREDGEIIQTGTICNITEQKRIEAELRVRASHDLLTYLPNRDLFVRRVDKELQEASQTSRKFAVMFIDLDGFKTINDSLGHFCGDKVLIAVAARIRNAVRASDMVARLGGDEFTVFVSDATAGLIHSMVHRIQDSLKEPILVDEKEIFISVGIGVAIGPKGYASAEEVIRHADIAMYRAKSRGQGEFQLFSREMQDQIRHRLSLETDIRHALDKDQFELFYQPIIHVGSGKLAGFESLIRWRHPAHGLLPPGQFLRIAEEIGLMVPLSWWVMERAATQIAEWTAKYHIARDTYVTVNVAGAQFMQMDFTNRVQNILGRAGIGGRKMHLEVVEQIVMDDYLQAAAKLHTLRGAGCEIYLDDFGTGYSSLHRLDSLPLDKVKLDRAFFGGSGGEPDYRLLRAIVSLAKTLDIQTVAEGIETDGQVTSINDLGFDYAQGYLFGRPASAAYTENLMLRGEIGESALQFGGI